MVYRKRFNKYRPATKKYKGKRPIQKLVKNQALKQVETKELVTNVPSTIMKHGTVYTTRVSGIPYGTSGAQRIGERVFYCAFNIKLHINPETVNTLWRVLLVKDRTVFTSTDTFSFSTYGLQTTDLFRVTTDSSPTSIYNTDRVHIIASKVCRIRPKFANDAGTGSCAIHAKIMKPYQFKTGSQDGDYHNYYLVIIPWNETGTNYEGTTNSGYVYATIEQVFKDA